jgi:putative ABC transport system permease protein
MMALAVTVGVDLMVHSFRGTVSRWLEYSLPADLYLSVFTTPARRFAAGGATLGGEVVERLRQLPEVAGVNSLRHFLTTVDGREVRVVALELDAAGRSAFTFAQGDGEALWPVLEAGRAVMVSEPYAYHHGVSVGSVLQVATPRGLRELPVAAVFYDYSSEQGLIMLGRRLYRQLWGDAGVTAVSLHLASHADLPRLEAAVREALGPHDRARLVSNRELRAQSLRVFDRTFAITSVLRMLAVIVAFVGILSALMALQLERTREFGVLRACGLTPAQLWRLVTQQTGLMGLTAGLLSLPVGIVMAAIMVYVINRRSFGWSLELSIAPTTLWQALAVALVAALLAGCYPAWRMARTSPSESLREE